MYIEVVDRHNTSTYINTEQINHLQFDNRMSRVCIHLSDGEDIMMDYGILFPYPARKINYRTWIQLQKMVGLHKEESVQENNSGGTST